MQATQIKLPKKLIPVFAGEADVRYAHGGRGSGKTRSFAKMIAVEGYRYGMAGITGILLCARQFMNSLSDSSLEECKRAIEDEPFLAAYYEIGDNYIKSHDGRIAFVFAGLDRNIASIKSKGRILVCWVDEAEPVTDEAWTTLIPTLREEGEGWNAELWVTWNPKRKTAAVERRFRASNDPRFKGVELNWRDNPCFPKKLERDRQRDLEERPEQYEHIWEGAFVTALEGAYFAKHLLRAKEEGRIGFFPADPLMTIRLFADIGGTGARADAFALWAAQYIGREIRFVNHYEAVGQPLEAHLAWCRKQGYEPDRAQFWLPHDGAANDKVYDVSYESALRKAGYKVTVVPNQGKGAAAARIERMRNLFPQIRFNEATTEAGRTALGWYHEKRDEDRGIGLGPEHDWSSHSCLVAGSMVETTEGLVPIEQVRRGMRVMTPAGESLVSWAGKVKAASELIRVTLEGGECLTMTPEHKVFTTRGVVCAYALRHTDSVVNDRGSVCLKLERAKLIGYRAAFIENFSVFDTGSGPSEASMYRKRVESSECFTASRSGMVGRKLCRSMEIGKTSIRQIGSFVGAILEGFRSRSIRAKNSMGSSSISIRSADTTAVAILESSTCIDTYGSSTMELSLPGSMFITRTRTKATTESRILRFFRPALIPAFTLKKASGLVARRIWRSLQQVVKRPLSGTAAKRGVNGIASMPAIVGRVENCSSGSATNVEAVTKRRIRSDRSFAAGIAKIERLTGESTPVYDLTVEHDHCYMANGMLVSNSDAAGLACVAWQEPQVMKPIQYPKIGIA